MMTATLKAPELLTPAPVRSSDWLERRARKRERNRLWMNRWRKNNIETAREMAREWDRKHPGANAKQLKEWYQRHKASHIVMVKKWKAENAEKMREYYREYQRHQIAILSDYYVRTKLSRGTEVKRADWPKPLVKLKQAQLKVTRLCRKSRTTTN